LWSLLNCRFPLYTLFKLVAIFVLSFTKAPVAIYSDVIAPLFTIYEATLDQLIEKVRSLELITFTLPDDLYFRAAMMDTPS